MRTNAGNDIVGKTINGTSAYTGTATATTATSITATGTPWSVNAYVGQLIVAGGVYGVCTSNTAGVATVDQWYVPGTPGGVAGTTPGATSVFTILPGQAPLWFLALTANSTAPAAGNTTLAGEITTAGGGLLRKLGIITHTGGTSLVTVTGSWTVTGSDVLPVTIAKMGVFPTLVGSALEAYETLLTPSTATLSASGDPLTVTWSNTV